MSINDSSSSLAPDNKANYNFSPNPSIIPIAFACGSGLAFVAIVIFFQFIFNRIDSSINATESTRINVVRRIECIRGLSKFVIASLPTFKYNKKSTKAITDDECSVCLEPFQDGEIVRELPRCRHLFHTDCIDMWLYSHVTCPMCRSVVVGAKEGRKKVAAADPPASALPPV